MYGSNNVFDVQDARKKSKTTILVHKESTNDIEHLLSYVTRNRTHRETTSTKCEKGGGQFYSMAAYLMTFWR